MKISVDFNGKKQVNAHFKDFEINSDQPISSGGEGKAPTPFELFLASMATCAGIYTRDFCITREISTEGITLEQEIVFNKTSKLLEKVFISILVPVSFPSKYDEALIHVASLCLVKKQLREDIELEIKIIRS